MTSTDTNTGPTGTGTTGTALDRMPKVDLHCHLIGTVRAGTFAELARREGLDLPAGR